MSYTAKKRRLDRHRRHYRIRKSLRGTAQRPRLAVYRSNRHISAQIIDDSAGNTLAAAASTEQELRPENTSITNSTSDTAGKVGTLLAERAKAIGVETVVFDRGGFRYHGQVAALADAAREGGLKF